MTEFHLVPDSAYSSGPFALPRGPAGVPTGGFYHSTRLTSGPTAPSAFAVSARRVLQVLPGLLYLTAYPNPLMIIARILSQRHVQVPRALCSARYATGLGGSSSIHGFLQRFLSPTALCRFAVWRHRLLQYRAIFSAVNLTPHTGQVCGIRWLRAASSAAFGLVMTAPPTVSNTTPALQQSR